MVRYRKYFILFIEVLIALSIIFWLEMIMDNVGLKLDLTPESRYSLSASGKEIINAVEDKLKITVFVKLEGEQEQIRALLDLYKTENPLVDYELVNLDRFPGLAKKYNVNSYYTTILEYHGKTVKAGTPTEKYINNALERLLGKEKFTIYFVYKTGDREILKTQGGEHDYDFARMRMLREGYCVESIGLDKVSNITKHPTILVLAGPQKDYDFAEIDILREFMYAGGRIMFFLDPIPLPNLEKFLEEFGIYMPRKLIVDKEGHPPQWDDWTIIIPFINKEHPIAVGIDQPAVFPLCRPVEEKSGDGKESNGLIASGRTSWMSSSAMDLKDTVSFDPEKDKRGPIAVGVAKEIEVGHGQKTKLTVVGNSRFFDNTYIKLLDNGKLFLNSLHWTSRTDIISSASPLDYGRALFLTKDQYGELLMLCCLPPLIIMIIGGSATYIRRRRAANR